MTRKRTPARAALAARGEQVAPSSEEMRWLRTLAECGDREDLRADAAAIVAAGTVDAVTLRAARVCTWSTTCGDRHAAEHMPGGLAATPHEIQRARKWRGEPASMTQTNGESAVYLACLYAAPAPPPLYLGHGSTRGLAYSLADSIRTIRHRAWHDAHKWTPKGYKLRAGHEDPSAEWTETPEQIAELAFGVSLARPGTDALEQPPADSRQLCLVFA